MSRSITESDLGNKIQDLEDRIRDLETGLRGVYENWHTIGDPGEPPYLIANVTNWAAPHGPVRFRKNRFGMVEITGLAFNQTGGNVAGNLFQLPVGYRPPANIQLIFVGKVAGGTTRIDVTAGGQVQVSTAGTDTAWVTGSWVSLSGVVFSTL